MTQTVYFVVILPAVSMHMFFADPVSLYYR